MKMVQENEKERKEWSYTLANKVSVRDKVNQHFNHSFNTTQEIILAIQSGSLPDKVMMNFHPQRWMNKYGLWVKEKYIQKIKNMIKYILISVR